MHRFITFVWDHENASVSSRALQLISRVRNSPVDWITRVDTNGFVVLDKPRPRDRLHAYVLERNRGVILGQLFRTSAEYQAPELSFDESTSDSIVKSGGQELVDNYWGGYVAFLHDSHARRDYILRDCSGKIPCYTMNADGVLIAFSDVADVTELPSLSFSVNWEYVSAFVYFNDLELTCTGLREVQQLLAGERLEVRPDTQIRKAVWNPARVCERGRVEHHDRAVIELRKTTQACINAWAAQYQSILLSLSGGFDSSVVLACLAQAPVRPATVCVNRYNEVAGEDERSYARMAAEHCRMPLLEIEWNPHGSPLDGDLFTTPSTVRPTVAMIFEGMQARILNEVAEPNQAEAIWTGQGGDHLFFQHKTPLTATDHFRRHGIGSGLVAAIRDAATLTELSYWEVLKEALNPKKEVISTPDRKARWRPDHLSQCTPYFLRKDSLPADLQRYVSHYWFESVCDLPLGKQSQIHYLAEVLNRHTSVPGLAYAEEHHALLSQPIIELCLQIPSYLHVKGGYPRALAHEAFKSDLPAAITKRRSKGSTARVTMGLLDQSNVFLRELLLDGVLVKEGILDRTELMGPLTNRQPLRYKQVFPLLACIAAEIWARQWTETSLRAVA